MLREYIRMIIEAEDDDDDVWPERIASEREIIDDIFKDITEKFDSMVHAATWPYHDVIDIACNKHKLAIFWGDYNSYANMSLRAEMFKSALYSMHNGHAGRLQLLNAKTIEKYIRKDLKQFDILVYFNKKLHTISKENLERLLHIARTYDEFEVLVKRVAKTI